MDEESEIINYTCNDKINFMDYLGYKYYLSLQNLSTINRRNTTPAIFFQNNPYTYENINNYLKLNNIKLEVFTRNPKNSTCKLEWKCLIHNNVFDRSWNSIKNGSVMCPECELISFRNKRCHTLEYVKLKALENFNINIVSKEYVNNETKLDFICNNHKDLGVQHITWGNMLDSVHPCSHCLKKIVLKKTMKSHENFIKQVKEIHGNKYIVLSEYEGSNKYVQVYCLKCKNEFNIRASHLLEGHGCGICTKSKGEEQIKLILDKYNINYIREYRFNDCRGVKKLLPFDFYLKDLNLLIEYQGKQHYEPVEMFGGQKQFETQQINDNCKRQYCKSKNINLLEIPYWDFNNIETILINKINEL
ncbi:TPA: hypothetical protein LA460_003380 [Clostridium botulinum]|nr:hypothetical protein [Clostridium botulinum]HBJ1655886.1 hypothetical protein [Clostridium botulinum]